MNSIPAVFCFDISSGGELRFRETLTLAGNPLDIAISEATSSIIITIDNVHESGTTSISRSTQEHGSFQSFVRRSETEHGSWVESSEGMRAMNLQGSFEMTDVQKKALPDLLYGVSNLRKRGNDEHSSS